MRKYLILTFLSLTLTNNFGQVTYSPNVDNVVFDSDDDGNTHGLFDPSTEVNPYSINQGYSIPTSFTGVKPTYTQKDIIGLSLPSIPSFGCNTIPGASTILNFLGLDCNNFSFPGFSLGAGIIFDTEYSFEIDVDFKNFSGDEMHIVYPSEISVQKPNDFTFNAGDWINLKTSDRLNTAGAWKLDTKYPQTGHIESWLDFNAVSDVSLGFEMNIFGLAYDLKYPIMEIDLQDVLVNGLGLSDARLPIYKVDTTRSFCWGDVVDKDELRALYPVQGWFPNLPFGLESLWKAFPQCQNPYDDIEGYCQTAQFYDDELPLEPEQGPLTGMLTIPEVNTTASTSGDMLVASGDSNYTAIKLSIPDLAAMILDEMEGCAKCKAAAFVLSHLKYSLQGIRLPGFQDDLGVSYELFTATIDLNQTNEVDVEFDPTIYGRYDLPTPVEYQVFREGESTAYLTGSGTQISYKAGDSVRIKYPCHYQEMTVERSYSIDGKVTTTIGDSYSITTGMTAAGVDIKIPGFNLLPSFSFSADIPYPSVCFSRKCAFGICINIPYPCIDYYRLDVTFPGVTIPSLNFNTCSNAYALAGLTCDASSGAIKVYEETITDLPATPPWYTNTWSFEGFAEEQGQPLILRARNFSASINNITGVTDVGCHGQSTGAINVDLTNGTAPFTYNWTHDSGGTLTTTEDLTGLEAGNYFVNITDANGCIAAAGATVEEPEPLIVTGQGSDISCFGLSDGSIDIAVTGGTSTYNYSWSSGGSTQNVSGLGAGLHTVTVTDANTCMSMASFTLNEPSDLAELSSNITHINCNGDNTGAVDVEMTGGTAPYSFLWNTSETSEDISNKLAGAYSVRVLDANNCREDLNYVINQPTAIAVNNTTTPVSCYGFNDGTIDVSVSGGTPFGGGVYNYAWYDQQGQLTSLTTQDNPAARGGNHRVIVKDANGCEQSSIAAVSEPTQLEITSASTQDVNCFGMLTGQIDIQVGGGTPGYNYTWTTSNGSGLIPANQDQLAIGGGDYSVQVMDANGCSISGMYSIIQPAEALAITTSQTNASCFGFADGTASVSISGGTLPYAIDWSTDGTGDFDDAFDIEDLSTGPYTVNIRDQKNCLINGVVNITQPSSAVGVSTTHTDVSCYDGADGSIQAIPSGGTPPYTYTWAESNSTLINNTTDNLTGISSDSYKVIVLDANGCKSDFDTFIGQPSMAIALSTTSSSVDCFGASTGGIDLTATGGTGPYSFDWEMDGLGDNDDTEDVSLLAAGPYKVLVMDANGCLDSIVTLVDQPDSALYSSISKIDVVCFGENGGKIDLHVGGGTVPYTFDWNNDGIGDMDDTKDLEFLPSGFYNVNIVDGNGCTTVNGAYIAQPASAVTYTPTLSHPTCYSKSDGTISLDITGGTLPYYVEWGSESEILLKAEGENLRQLPIGKYFARVADARGCSYLDSVVLVQPDPLDLTFSVTDASCFNGADGTITVAPSGGTVPYAFAWSNSATTQDISGLNSGTYSLVLMDSNNCEWQGSATVGQASQIKVTEQIIPLSCADQSDAAIDLFTNGGTSPYTWTWNNGALTENIQGLSAGDYQVNVRDVNGCTETFNYTIAASEVPCIAFVDAFTPNGDAYNDTWEIRNIDLYPNAEVIVYNRWGRIIYTSIGAYDAWDGTLNGDELPSETYYYTVKLNNPESDTYSGTVTIIR